MPKLSKNASKQVESILVFRNGNWSAFDPDGEQISDLQKITIPELLAEWCRAKGYEIDGCRLDIGGPACATLKFNGQSGKWEVGKC